MTRTCCCYISGHGWGHASRAIELLNAIGARDRRLRLIARSAVAPALFARAARVAIELDPLDTDPGIVQIDSLTLDEEATTAQAAAFYADFDGRVAREVAYLKRRAASIVIADVPPLAIGAAARAGIPSVLVGNFTWDWIYAGYPTFNRRAPGVIETIAEAYRPATRALRLPMHGGFASARTVTDIPFIARRSARDRDEVRRLLSIPAGRPAVLVSFGAYGADLEPIRASDALTLIDQAEGFAANLRYEDLVAAADAVVSKPGYGIISECIANGTALLYTSRGRFVEYDVMVAAMPRVLRCRFLPPEDLRAGRWADAVRDLLTQPPPPERPRVDGAAVAAEAILDLLM